MNTEKNTVEQLIESAKEKGTVSESDILQLAEQSGFDNDQFDRLCEMIEGSGIEIDYTDADIDADVTPD